MTDHLNNMVRLVLTGSAAGLVLALLVSAGAGQTTVPGQPLDEVQVAEVRIEGNRGFSEAQIAGQLMTRVGRPFDHGLVQSDVRKLFHLGWFSNVEPYFEDGPNGRIVIFQVTERPTIRYIQFLGAKKISVKKLEKQVGLKRGETIDPYRVEEGRNKIEEFYREKGFNRVQVFVEEGDSVEDQGVVYVINEGASQRVWSVQFVGNTFVSGRRLKTQVKSKPGILWVFSGYVDPKKIEADKERLTAYYRAFGFFQARVEALKEFNDGGNWLTLKYIIHEGPRYQIRRVSFVGNTQFPSSALLERLQLQTNQPFDQFKMDRDRTWLQDLYGSKGYVFADILAEPRFLEESGMMDLVYRIEEGKQWRVGQIFVHIDGPNPHTRIQTALNRLSLRSGDIMDIRELKASERRLQACGLFRNEPAMGVSPKIVYRIPELQDSKFAEHASGGQFRGQSPDTHGSHDSNRYLSYRPLPGDHLLDVHVYAESQPENVPPDRAAPASDDPGANPAETDRNKSGENPPSGHGSPQNPDLGRNSMPRTHPVHPAYRNLFPSDDPASSVATRGIDRSVVRGQNPNYGGQMLGATGPDAARTQLKEPRMAQADPVFQPGTPVSPSSPDPLPPPGGPQPLFPYPQVGPVQPFFTDPAVDLHLHLEETETGRFMAGASVNSDLGLFGSFVIDERNFNWRRWPTSWEDIRNGTAWRGAGQRFRLEAAPGSEMNRYLVSFQEPYLWDSPISLGLSGFYYDRRFRDWDEQRLGGRVSLGYQWTDRDIAVTASYRGENVNIHDPAIPTPPELADVLGDNVLHGFGMTVVNDTRDSAFLATSGHYIEMMFEQVIGSYDYPRATLDMRQYFLLHERPDRSGRHVLSYSTRFGYSGTQTPIYEHFFAGGFSTLRGFDYRCASPVRGNVRVGGEFQWLNSLEYLYPISADDMVRGIVFCDFGTVEPEIQIEEFRVAPGVGLRIIVPAMGPAPIALDLAWPILRADYDEQEQFSFHIGFQR